MEPHTLRLDPTEEAPRLARHAVQDLAFPNPPAHDLTLALSELVTNSVRHARLDADAQIEVHLYRRSDSVRVEVCDSGRDFRIAVREGDEAGGRGLMIVEALAEQWGIRRNGQTCVWFEMPIQSV